MKERVGRYSASIPALEQAYEENEQMVRRVRAEMRELSREQSAQTTNRLDEAQRRFDQLQRFGEMLSARIAAEKTDLSLPVTGMAQIVDRAAPGSRPVRPNKPLNIAVGIIVGGFGGLFLATPVYALQLREFRRRSGVPRTTFPPRFRAVLHVFITLVVGFIVGYVCANPLAYRTIIGVPLTFLLGAIASAYIELANIQTAPAAVPHRTEPDA